MDQKTKLKNCLLVSTEPGQSFDELKCIADEVIEQLQDYYWCHYALVTHLSEQKVQVIKI